MAKIATKKHIFLQKSILVFECKIKINILLVLRLLSKETKQNKKTQKVITLSCRYSQLKQTTESCIEMCTHK
jgi:hypothetical protein